jgi:hypothetical protein
MLDSFCFVCFKEFGKSLFFGAGVFFFTTLSLWAMNEQIRIVDTWNLHYRSLLSKATNQTKTAVTAERGSSVVNCGDAESNGRFSGSAALCSVQPMIDSKHWHVPGSITCEPIPTDCTPVPLTLDLIMPIVAIYFIAIKAVWTLKNLASM